VERAKRAVAWVKDDPFGVEFAEIGLAPGRLSAHGVAIGSAPHPYRLDYTLETRRRYVTSRLRVMSRGEEWRRQLDLRRDPTGSWSVSPEEEGDIDPPPAGGDPSEDLLAGGGPIDLTVAWVSVPDLSVQADGQRYTFLRGNRAQRIIRYEAIDGTFAAEITLDPDGIAIDYPGIARRLARFPNSR
jgi:hypothetical protein